MVYVLAYIRNGQIKRKTFTTIESLIDQLNNVLSDPANRFYAVDYKLVE